MSFAFAAVTPHNPALVPTIGKGKSLLTETKRALEQVAKSIAERKLDTIFIITPHSSRLETAFGINLAPRYFGDFKKFGDLITTCSVAGDTQLAYQTREYIETKKNVTIFSEPELDHATAVTVVTVLGEKPIQRVVPISVAGSGIKEHFDFGTYLRHKADLSSKKVGVIATAHLSHRLTEDSRLGYHKDGVVFDEFVRKQFRNNTTKDLVTVSEDVLTNAAPCGFLGIIMLLGMIQDFNYSASLLSYESLFGIGHITATFDW